MQQEGGRRSDQEDMKPNKQPQQQPPPQQQHQQKCPRCDSLNTKFCYYNNYSLSQPRYFCKACRRYWTQGGTLRNVPVGGGCRKGKRAKTSSSATTSSGTTSTTNNTSHTTSIATGGTVGANKETDGNSVVRTPHPPTGFAPMGFGSFSYPAIGGGFLSSLAAIQSFAHPGVGGINLGGDLRGRSTGGSSSDLGLLMHGFNSNAPPPAPLLAHHFGSQLQGQQPITRQFYHSGGDGDTSRKTTPGTSTITLVGQGPPAFSYPQEESLIQSRRVPEAVSTVAASSSSYQPQLNWPHHQGFTYHNLSDTSLWSISTTTTTTTSSTVGSSSMNPNQWHDLPGYDPPQS